MLNVALFGSKAKEWREANTDKKAQLYYLKKASEQNWGVRQLGRNINTLYYQRILSSQNPQPVEEEMLEKTKDYQFYNRDFIRNPTVLEFLNIPSLFDDHLHRDTSSNHCV